MKVFKYITLSLLGLIVGILILAYIQDSFFYHPLTGGAVKDLLGQDGTELDLERRIDFIGIDIHGDIFDYHKYSLDSGTVNRFIREGKSFQYPLFKDSLYISPRQAGPLVFSRWKQTPLICPEDQEYVKILKYGNLQNYRSSRLFVKANYLTKPGNYYAYFSTYPIGRYLYVLVPSENTLYLIRTKG